MMPSSNRCTTRVSVPAVLKSSAAALRAGVLATGALAVALTVSSLTAGSATASDRFQSVFDCGDVVGKVFNDKNRNGYQDEGEQGLPGVRLASVNGLLTITDQHGRYHVTCADLPRGGIGSIFLLKLDGRTLPTGYRITSENPRAVRLTAGKVTKLNFGASLSRVVRLDLESAAFKHNSTDLNPKWGAGIDQLINVLGEDHSILRLVYQKGSEDKALADRRMKAVSRLVNQRWEKRDGGYPLEIERRLMTGT